MPRAGHRDWTGTDWTRYRARVTPDSYGPWRIHRTIIEPGDPMFDRCADAGAPCEPGTYTCLTLDEYIAVMSDAPSELAGMLDFLENARGRVLISGLGLGIVPAHLLQRADIDRIDVIEISGHLIHLLANNPGAQRWINDPRLTIHQGDAHTIELNGQWDHAWHSIWGLPSAANAASMRALTARWNSQARNQACWEQAECEAIELATQ